MFLTDQFSNTSACIHVLVHMYVSLIYYQEYPLKDIFFGLATWYFKIKKTVWAYYMYYTCPIILGICPKMVILFVIPIEMNLHEFKNTFDPNRFSNKNASKVSIYELIATSW